MLQMAGRMQTDVFQENGIKYHKKKRLILRAIIF